MKMEHYAMNVIYDFGFLIFLETTHVNYNKIITLT